MRSLFGKMEKHLPSLSLFLSLCFLFQFIFSRRYFRAYLSPVYFPRSPILSPLRAPVGRRRCLKMGNKSLFLLTFLHSPAETTASANFREFPLSRKRPSRVPGLPRKIHSEQMVMVSLRACLAHRPFALLKGATLIKGSLRASREFLDKKSRRNGLFPAVASVGTRLGTR